MNHPTLRLTPSNSPFFRNAAPRSPTKAPREEEPGLSLSRAIGSTTASCNGFDCNSSERTFVYAAGAVAVVCQLSEDLKISQRFFKAKPTYAAPARESSLSSLNSPTPIEARTRTLGHARENSTTGSPLASSRDWSDSPNGRSATAKDRVKTITSVALSPNGKWLAVGETGYKPRILLFSLVESAADLPVTIISEHTFGVHALSFSPDSRYLASLGNVNDGFLYIWSVDDRGSPILHASNKCTVLVNAMAWLGRSLVTVGLRFVKVWRPDETPGSEVKRSESMLYPGTPRQRADNRSGDFGNSILSPRNRVLSGKNVLLSDMLDCNFVSLAVLNSAQAAVCAVSGEICLLDDVDDTQSLREIATAPFAVTAATLNRTGGLRVMGAGGSAVEVDTTWFHDPIEVQTLKQAACASPTLATEKPTTYIVSAARIKANLVTLDSSGTIEVRSDEDTTIRKAGHGEALAGVVPVKGPENSTASFLTFSAEGSLQIWNTEGNLINHFNAPLPEARDLDGVVDSISAVESLARGSMVVCGSRTGVLSVVNIQAGSVSAHLRAHSSEIADICCFKRDDVDLLATAGRDRVAQLFLWRDDKLELLQTMDEHAAAVTGLLVVRDGNRLLSSSSDRSVVVREAWQRDEADPLSILYVIVRTITFKAAPTAMCLGGDDDSLLVATTDRTISRYSISNGQAMQVFKCSDAENGEAAIMSKLIFAPSLSGTNVIIGISSSDKSVRMYSERGILLGRDWGHTEGVTGLAMVQASSTRGEADDAWRLVTVAADSTIFVWDPTATIAPRSRDNDRVAELTSFTKLATTAQPLRKVISYSELARFRRESSLEDADPSSPIPLQTPTNASPTRLRKKPSRMSNAQAPKLEPAFRSSVADFSSRSSRRQSLRQRSPSPPSPRNITKRQDIRRPSLGMSPRSKSSENVRNTVAPSTINTGFGSLTASTESASRTLRAYRKKLAGTQPGEGIAPEALQELEKELKLTAKVLGERSQGKTINEATMARLLDQTSEKIVGMLDDRIKERVESELRKSAEGSPTGVRDPRGSLDSACHDTDALAGAVEGMNLKG
ncbi:hypothetical protein LTR78_005112 [Recurvomyces mirabilis]|uniref:WD40 repeat-like protein n=1 Tax=Recurvomyces mirabilis TaxID=574656 RepID=A0AAE1C201_9PEZI|nr:hypothetical protein LTR78_005112 [Recurvomyces mirabilis]KAK5158273.1 hypothetical protein LTS14_003291 [Recurvomyces mirabilis]